MLQERAHQARVHRGTLSGRVDDNPPRTAARLGVAEVAKPRSGRNGGCRGHEGLEEVASLGFSHGHSLDQLRSGRQARLDGRPATASILDAAGPYGRSAVLPGWTQPELGLGTPWDLSRNIPPVRCHAGTFRRGVASHTRPRRRSGAGMRRRGLEPVRRGTSVRTGSFLVRRRG